MKKNIKSMVAILLLGVFFMSACDRTNSNNEHNEEVNTIENTDDNKTEEIDKEEPESINKDPLEAFREAFSKFPREIVNHEESIEGGVLRYGVVTDGGFRGIFAHGFSSTITDITVANFIHGIDGFLSLTEDLIYGQKGLATYEIDVQNKTFTLNMTKPATWHDGNILTLDDLVFAYEVIAHPDYDGTRYSDATGITKVVGAKEYKKGEADSISGLVLSDDKMSLTIHYTEMSPSILYNGIWNHPLPRHYFEGIEVKDMAASANVRTNPIGFGPFKVKNIVPGESVELVRFDNYWKGTPKLDGVVLETISSELVPTAMEEGYFDIVFFSAQSYSDYQNPTNFTYIADIENAYSYTGFRFGTFDRDLNISVPNQDFKMNDVNLRRAIGYAIDNERLAKEVFSGIRFSATSIITPFHMSFLNEELQGFYYDKDLANQILDEAGYTKRDSEGYRMTPTGEPLTISWAVMQGENAEVIATHKIQEFKDVGLRVELYGGRLMDSTAMIDMLRNDTDDFEIDMFDANWNLGNNPNPVAQWGSASVTNYTRYTSDRFEELLSDIGSEKAWDRDLLNELFYDWQEAFFEEVPAIPNMWRITLMAVNNRVKNYSLVRKDGRHDYSAWAVHLWELTNEEPYVK